MLAGSRAVPLLAVLVVLAAGVAGCGGGSGRSTASSSRAAAGTSSTSGSASASGSATTSAPSPSGPQLAGHLAVTPSTGHPDSVLRFTLRVQSTPAPPERMQVTDALSVSGPAAHGCVATHSVGLAVPAAGRAVSVSLGPSQLRGRWCPGSYQARVEVLARPRCGPAQMCPQFIRVVGEIGPIRFRITP